MTSDDRLIVLRALWIGVRHTHSMSPRQARRAVDVLHTAIEAIYNDHGDDRAVVAYAQGKREAEATARDEGYRAGMLAVERRADYRDPFETKDPEELRNVH